MGLNMGVWAPHIYIYIYPLASPNPATALTVCWRLELFRYPSLRIF